MYEQLMIDFTANPDSGSACSHKLGATKTTLLSIVRQYGPVAAHEAAQYLRRNGVYVSENAVASRLWEMTRDKYIKSRYRQNKPFKEWFI